MEGFAYEEEATFLVDSLSTTALSSCSLHMLFLEQTNHDNIRTKPLPSLR